MAAEELELRLWVPLPSARAAVIAVEALRPDPPPKRAGLRWDIEAEGAGLRTSWRGGDARRLRAAVTAFLELLGVVLETMERFGDPPPQITTPPPPKSQ